MAEDRDYRLKEWLDKRRISANTYYSMKARGIAPRTLDIGNAVIITAKEDAAWEKRMLDNPPTSYVEQQRAIEVAKKAKAVIGGRAAARSAAHVSRNPEKRKRRA